MRAQAAFAVLALAVLASAVGAIATGCGSASQDDPSPGPPIELVIGDLVPISGPLASLGPSGRRAADLAIDQINEAIGAAGVDHAVEIIHSDSTGDPAGAAAAARKAIDRGASCITGPWSSAQAAATAEESTVPATILQIAPHAGAPELAMVDDSGLLNLTAPPDERLVQALAAQVDDTLGDAATTKVALAVPAGAGAESLIDAFTRTWEDRGGALSATDVVEFGEGSGGSADDAGALSPSSAAAALISQAPDAIVIAETPEAAPRLLSALGATRGWDPAATFLAGDFETSKGKSGEDLPDGLRALTSGAPPPPEAEAEFERLFASSDAAPADPGARVAPPTPTDAQSFDAVVLCYLAAVAAGSTDGSDMASVLADVSGPGGIEMTWQDLPDAIDALQHGRDIDYQGASGPIDLDQHGSPTAGTLDLLEIQGGRPTLIGQVPLPED